jgi:hypothetical protein
VSQLQGALPPFRGPMGRAAVMASARAHRAGGEGGLQATAGGWEPRATACWRMFPHAVRSSPRTGLLIPARGSLRHTGGVALKFGFMQDLLTVETVVRFALRSHRQLDADVLGHSVKLGATR